MTLTIETDSDLRRLWWALFLDSKVEADGQIRGFSEWCQAQGDDAYALISAIPQWCVEKIRRDGRDPEECLRAGIRYARQSLAMRMRPAAYAEPTHAEVGALIDMLAERLSWDKAGPVAASGLAAMLRAQRAEWAPLTLTPAQVAEAQEQAARLRSAAPENPPA